MIFIVLLNILLFKIKIYFHKKIAIAIILFFSTLKKIISIISIYESEDEKVYKQYIWILFFGVIGFLLCYAFDSYSLCKIKWYFDLKFISASKLMIYFGILGILFSFIGSLISNFIECNNDNFSYHVYFMYDENDSKYFDNFSIFFKQIWKGDRYDSVNIGYIFIILLKISMQLKHYVKI